VNEAPRELGDRIDDEARADRRDAQTSGTAGPARPATIAGAKIRPAAGVMVSVAAIVVIPSA
jgi:hypothetical protein